MEQRYKRPADWDIINEAAAAVSVPVVGNGDLLTLFEVQHRKQHGSTHALMTGRGALIKPWIFEEVKTVLCQIVGCSWVVHEAMAVALCFESTYNITELRPFSSDDDCLVYFVQIRGEGVDSCCSMCCHAPACTTVTGWRRSSSR
jgi:tRNA-dihydrouridine synthase